MTRPWNFSAGPACLPVEVLEQAQSEMLSWQGKGLSVMEMGHRGKDFTALAAEAEQDLRGLLKVPDDYRVLFMQGGATAQFSLVPLNILPADGNADYLDTGIWSAKAIAEARRFGRVNVVGSAEPSAYTSVPARADWQVDSSATYFHYTPNETIGGLEIGTLPENIAVPIVADMSSTILSRPLDIGRYALIYAGAQKNIGPAGITVVIVRESLLGCARPEIPSVFDYKRIADNDSMLNTPPTFSWYITGLVFKWLKNRGGVEAMADVNQRKAKLLYSAIDDSDFYTNNIDPAYRSWMNVPFTLADPELNSAFLEQSAAAALLNLKGHRSVGGMRASIYNAMPEEGVMALIEFMREFERKV